jgi:hypothetical protein
LEYKTLLTVRRGREYAAIAGFDLSNPDMEFSHPGAKVVIILLGNRKSFD